MSSDEEESKNPLKDFEANEQEKITILDIISAKGFHPNELLVEDNGDGTADVRAKAYSELFQITDNIIKPTYEEGHPGWPDDGYQWSSKEKNRVQKIDDNPTLRELLESHTDSAKVDKLYKKCVWLKIKGAEASLLEIGVDALKTDDYGGFSNEEISSIQQNICKDLGKLDPFPYTLPFETIYLDPLNYRIIEHIEKKEVHGKSINDFLKEGDHSRLVDDDLKSVVLESILSSGERGQIYRIQELVNSIQANGFEPEFPLAVIPIHAEFQVKDKETLDSMIESGEEIKFIVVDGNRRWTALNTINDNIQKGVVYKSKPRTAETLKKVLEKVPVIVKPARDEEDLKQIRLSTQTLHHHVGQEQWKPYSKARNVRASYESLKGSEESRIEVLKAKYGMKRKTIKDTIRSLTIMDKSVEEGFLPESKKSEKFGALSSLVSTDRWCKWIGMQNIRTDTWIPATVSTDRIKATFGLFESDGYAIRAGTHLNQNEFTRVISSSKSVDKIDDLIAKNNLTAEKAKQVLVVSDASEIKLTFEADLDAFLPKIKSFSELTEDDQDQLILEDSPPYTKFLRTEERVAKMKDDIHAARKAREEENKSKIPDWAQNYIDQSGGLIKIVLSSLLKDSEKREIIFSPDFDIDEFEETKDAKIKIIVADLLEKNPHKPIEEKDGKSS